MALLTVAHMIDLSVKPVEMIASKHERGYTLCYRYENNNPAVGSDTFDIALNARGEEKVYKTFEAVWTDVQKINPGSNLLVVSE